ncbi:CdaR family protein [Alkalicoccus daliensis]|uniref:YbbR domain-containing protein n=1 Tax=Alkalicoccus daliensis TaxID=745820 RepID=A0A1H0ESF8_9BACI|nr:CdaR family protein [Alkalicoccus daliensis]SDN85301.1 YbbR domain-containing protein [Alkalicoccus daliensis]
MDKLFSKGWFIKLTSIVIAVMLFLMVNMENQAANQTGAGIPGITDGERVMEEVPLNIYYDEENYVLTEAPETVQVNMRGPQNVLTLAQVTQGQQEVFVDLEGEEAGVHYARVEHRGFQPDLRLSIVPLTVRVTLQERQTTSFPVDVELENEGDIAEGYTAGEPVVEPSTVDVTAAEGMVNQVAEARVTIDLAGHSEDFTESASVVLYDDAGNELDITADPPAVDVMVPVTSPNKEVPLRSSREGSLTEGVAIDSINLNPEAVTIYGPVDVLNEISFIDIADINLSEIEGDSRLEVEVPVPEGVERVEPEQVIIEIETTSEEERNFSDFPVDVEGLGNDYNIEFPDLTDNEFTLEVRGSAELLERLDRTDFTAFIDVEGLEPGEHSVPLEIEAPQNVRLPQQGMTFDIILSTDDSADNPDLEENEEAAENEVENQNANETEQVNNSNENDAENENNFNIQTNNESNQINEQENELNQEETEEENLNNQEEE